MTFIPAAHTARTFALLCSVIACSVAGDLSVKYGMKKAGEIHFRFRDLLHWHWRVLTGGWVAIGVAAMAASFFLLLVLLSAASASSVIPATAGTFVLDTLGARFLLKENISGRRWAGALLVACGVGLIAM
jgi:drug/metabolite transporter (DMT)-like permease